MPRLPTSSQATQFTVPKGQQVQSWLQINTFRPGIFAYRHMEYSTNSVISTGPIGAADPTTYGCMALPQGGLGMLPGITAVATTTTSTYTNKTVQAIAFSTGQFTTNKILFLESIGYNGTDTKIRRILVKTGVVTTLSTTTIAGVPSYKQLVKFPRTTRLRTPWTAPLMPGKPQVVFVKQAKTGLGNVAIFPGLTNTGIVALTNTGKVLATIPYNSRILALTSTYQSTSKLPWYTQYINYADPFNSDVIGVQGAVINPTEISNWSSWGSVASGELVVIQQDGGGFLMTGDMNNLTILRLPGLQPGGNLYGGGNQATPGGFIYCSHNNGAWIWTGGSVARKFSTNLADNFFTVTTTDFKNYYCCDYYGSWIFFSNGWIFDLVTKGWWKVKSTYNYFFCAGHSQGMFLFPAKSHPTLAYFMSKTTTTTLKKFLWKSRPFRAATDRLIDVREIVIWASVTKTPTATNQIEFGIYKTTTSAYTAVTIPHTQLTRSPQPFRIPYAAQNLTNFNVSISGQSKSNITIWQITVGYNTRQRMKAVSA